MRSSMINQFVNDDGWEPRYLENDFAGAMHNSEIS